MTLKLDWSDRLVADLVATKAVTRPRRPPRSLSRAEEAGHALPPALAALVEERRVAQQAAAEAAVRASIVGLPPPTWREIQDRAASIGVQAALLADGARLHLVAELPLMDGAGVVVS